MARKFDSEVTPSGQVQVETWKNPTAGRVWVKRLDHRGELAKTEIVRSGGVFHLTTAERELNQELAVSEDLDLFANGTLTPIRLIEGTAAAREFATNPNLITEEDMKGLVKTRSKDAFVERLAAIKNPATLQRLAALSREEDAPLSKVEAIEARLQEVTNPAVAAESRPTTSLSGTTVASPTPSGSMEKTRAVTPN